MRVLFLQKYLPQEMLGIQWLCTALKRAGHEPRILFLPDAHWQEKLRESDPGLIAFSITTGDHRLYLEIARKAKDAVSAPVIFGGPHPTFVPAVALEPQVDFVCRGEGETPLAQLATDLELGGDGTSIPNLTWSRNGERIDNPLVPIASDLDALGAPDRATMYEAGHIYGDSERKIFLTQRGCLYNCSFCFHHAWRSKVYKIQPRQYLRKRTVDHVLAEIDDVRRRYPLKFVHFVDDIFNVDDEWLEHFCRRYKQEIGIPFDVILRTNLVNEDHVRWLREAGCISARLAFEAASDHVRNTVFRKATTLDDLRTSSRLVKSQGLRLTSLNLIGGPGTTIEDDIATARLNVDCKVDHPLCSLLQPYPETDINEITRAMGFAVDSFDAFPEKFNRTSSIASAQRRDFENLHKLFPIAIRFPSLLPHLPRLIRLPAAHRLYLAAYLLWTEYLVCEQNRLSAVATGTASLTNRPPVEFVRRVASKTLLKAREALFGRRFSRQRLALQMQEDTIAHMG